MSLVAGVTGMGRVQAEKLMTATGVVRRQTGTTPGTAPNYIETPTYTTIYTGKCRLRIDRSTGTNEANLPGVVGIRDQLILSLPVVGSEGVRPNDVWECTANPLDTSVVGLKLRIAGVHHGTHMTARRFPVEEIS